MRADRLPALACLAAACSSGDPETGLDLRITLVPGQVVDQLRVEGMHAGEELWAPSLLPESPEPLDEPLYRVVVLLADDLDGATVTVRVSALAGGVSVSAAEGAPEVKAGRLRIVELGLGPVECDPCPPVCGDAAVDDGEACDDGGVAVGDGCDEACAIEAGYSCTANASGTSLCTPTTPTACSNGEDDDEDGRSDLADPGCANMLDADERGTDVCDDGDDNDGDGRADYNVTAGLGDPGCGAPADVSEKCNGQSCSECDNGVDDDADSRLDYHADPRFTDPGCSGPDDASEKCAPGGACPECDDGEDNGDVDTAADADDPSCASPEAGEDGVPACANGDDDDGDGLVDLNNDPGCANVADTREQGTTGCDDGLDNDGDGLVDAADPGCANASDTSELSGALCDDGLDNDGDGRRDFRVDPGVTDPQCSSPLDDES